jgi:hypothetical protein
MKIDEIENTDERIDRALGLLGKAEAPAGMEDRLLRRIAERTSTRTPARWQPRRLAFAAGVSIAALAVAVALLHHRGAPAVGLPIVAQTQPAPQPASVPARPHPQPAARRVLSAKPAPASVAELTSFPAPPAPLTDQEKMLVRLAKAQERAMETAPQLAKAKQADVPLTHEEALLVAVSRVRQDAVIEALDPVRRAETDAREKREFNAYVQQKDGGS